MFARLLLPLMLLSGPSFAERHCSGYRFAAAGAPLKFTRSSNGQILREAKARGGSTYDPRSGEILRGQAMFVLSPYPDLTRSVSALTEAAIQKFEEDNAGLLAHKHHYVGIWKNPVTGRYELDIVVGLDSHQRGARQVAETLSRRYNQRAFYDLEAEKAIPVVGTDGGAPNRLPSVEERLRQIQAAIVRAAG